MAIVGKARARGLDVDVLFEHPDGYSQVRFTSGKVAGTTIHVISDEVEWPEGHPQHRPQPVDEDPTCCCTIEQRAGVDTVPDEELGMYVCGICSKPSREALEKAAAHAGLVW